jgi:hypothetical protein
MAEDPILAGWIEWNGRLLPDPTVKGALLRRMQLRGSCYIRNECRRSVTVDLQWLVDRGYGHALLEEVHALYGCRRTPTCEMSWSGGYLEGMPLQAFVGTEVRFRLECRDCLTHSDFTAEQLIAGLQRAGKGDGSTGVSGLHRQFGRRCRCGRQSWRVDLRLPARVGMGPAFSPSKD